MIQNLTSKIVFAFTAIYLCAVLPSARAQEAGAVGGGGPRILTPALENIVNPMAFQNRTLVCGGLQQAGTPIAGDADGADNNLATAADNGNSGKITISGIPVTATVKRAVLYWTVLTDSATTSSTGSSISFNGAGVVGTKIGAKGETPCFPQDNTIAWKADVTALVPSPGNGTYTVSGFPGGNAIGSPDPAPDFTEGATLQVLWSDPSAPLRDIVLYETPAGNTGLAVTNEIGDTLSQTVNTFLASAASGTLYPVVGNGQDLAVGETYSVVGGGPPVNLDNTLDGSTTTIPAESCSFTDIAVNDCFWDDDSPDLSGTLIVGDTSVTMNYTLTSDCHDFPAVAAAVRTNDTGLCQAGGQYVDAQCPAGNPWQNHGEYLACVAHAAEQFLGGTGCTNINPEVQSCIVNPRARNDVGKP